MRVNQRAQHVVTVRDVSQVEGPFVPQYRNFWAWNLTNKADYLSGAKVNKYLSMVVNVIADRALLGCTVIWTVPRLVDSLSTNGFRFCLSR